MLFVIASHLGRTVAELMRGLSAQEFTRWCLWFKAEGVGPRVAAQRHAELMAAVHNSGRIKPGGTQELFEPADFMREADPWHVPTKSRWATMSPEQLKRLHALHEAQELARMGA